MYFIQDGKVGRLVAERAAVFEAERLRMNTEADRIALEKTHVERDSTHLEVRYTQAKTMPAGLFIFCTGFYEVCFAIV